MTVSLRGIGGATVIVLLTTLDDAVWLVPFVLRAANRSTAVLHASLFVATLCSMALLASSATVWAEHFVDWSDTALMACGAGFCWALAGFLWYKKWQKRQRRKQAVPHQERNEGDPLLVAQGNDDDNDDDEKAVPRPWMVISLTFVGSVDEISYFPSLILGQVFRATELVLGATLAALIMLVIVLVFLQRCLPLMACLDKIPLYGVVSVFACLLTGELLWDLFAGPE